MSIVAQNLTVSLDGKMILKDLSLTLPGQGIVGLSGPSGCGKTTLLHTLCGLIKPDTGDLSGILSLKVAMVFQEDRLLPWLTAGDNLDLVLRDRSLVRLWLKRMLLTEQEDQYPGQLSGGMKRRIALARALAIESDLLLLDEPFKGMDETLKETLYDWLYLAGKNKPVILVTHDAGELADLASQVWRADGPPLNIFTAP
ncbi:MAG: ATP-binding cassette domain-containing protein [Bacillota bacterium]|nr:ATP-binding cassette domain-containing protein [Bacillota bacterium]